MKTGYWIASVCLLAAQAGPGNLAQAAPGPQAALPAIRIAADGRGFETGTGKPFVPFGVNYYRPGTGWAPQLWKKLDPEATRADFARLRELGANCVRVFVTYGSFCQEPDKVSEEGLLKFDRMLALAEEAGLYLHPTGPDHWEGTPAWMRGEEDIVSERRLAGLEAFWREFAARYRGRAALFAYDLRNEPHVPWGGPAMERKWNDWLGRRYSNATQAAAAWGSNASALAWGRIPAPPAADALTNRLLLDYQDFRESVADTWTSRQAAAIKAADPRALVTVGLIQWSVPSLLPGVQHYSAFRPSRQAAFLDFMEIHFYPLNKGFYAYASAEDEARNLAYLESVVGAVAAARKPTVVAEFGWYGGGKLSIDNGRHPAASEEQQAQWNRRLVETTAGLACGWLNWGFYDQPEARDVSQLTGLLTADGRTKAWGREFKALAAQLTGKPLPQPQPGARPELDWSRAISSVKAGHEYREEYYRAFQASPQPGAGKAAAGAAPRPNIVYFLIDDLGYADCGFNGGREIETPQIDKLAASGARLAQFYAQPVCSPTRAALLTGRYPMRHGLQVGVVRPWARYGLPLTERTLPQALKEAGYFTALAGKWHLGHFDPAYLPTRRGFDSQYGHYNGALDYFTHVRDGGFDWHRNDRVCRDEGYSTHLVAAEAVRVIREQPAGKPFFLYVAFNAVHAPHQVPEKYKAPYAALKEPRRTYAGMLAATDEAIGQIVAAVEDRGQRTNTLFLFSSDNGGPAPGRVTDNGPLRAGKGTLYEGGVRVCAFASWAGRIQPGLVISEPLHIADWYPTLLKLAGAPTAQAAPLDGQDIWPVLTAGQSTPHREILHNTTPVSGALRAGDWKLILNGAQGTGEIDDEAPARKAAKPKGQRARPAVQLFNLAQDPGETNNLADRHPDKVQDLRARYEAYARQALPPRNAPRASDFKTPAVWGE